MGGPRIRPRLAAVCVRNCCRELHSGFARPLQSPPPHCDGRVSTVALQNLAVAGDAQIFWHTPHRMPASGALDTSAISQVDPWASVSVITVRITGSPPAGLTFGSALLLFWSSSPLSTDLLSSLLSGGSWSPPSAPGTFSVSSLAFVVPERRSSGVPTGTRTGAVFVFIYNIGLGAVVPAPLPAGHYRALVVSSGGASLSFLASGGVFAATLSDVPPPAPPAAVAPPVAPPMTACSAPLLREPEP